MTVTVILSICYLGIFQICCWPAIIRVYRRKSSADLSVWREWLLMVGALIQYVVMARLHTSWFVRVSPLASEFSVGFLLIMIYRYRR